MSIKLVKIMYFSKPDVDRIGRAVGKGVGSEKSILGSIPIEHIKSVVLIIIYF